MVSRRGRVLNSILISSHSPWVGPAVHASCPSHQPKGESTLQTRLAILTFICRRSLTYPLPSAIVITTPP